MDIDRALAELGVTRGVDPETLRRAYLRQVRAHPPERDPEGFKRVRSAYDFLREQPWLWSAPEDEPVPSEQDGAGSPVCVVPESASAPAHDTGTSRAPSEADASGVSSAPAGVGSKDEAPPEPDPAVLDSAFETWMRLQGPAALERPEETASLMIELFGSTSSTLLPPAWSVFEVILVLVRGARVDRAAELLAAFEARLALDGTALHALSTELAARYKLIRELIALRGMAPKGAMVALAKAIQDGNLLGAGDAVTTASKLAGASFNAGFAQRAPTLHMSLKRFFVEPEPSYQLGSAAVRFGWSLMFIILIGIRAFSDEDSSKTSHSAATAAHRDRIEKVSATEPPVTDSNAASGEQRAGVAGFPSVELTAGQRLEHLEKTIDIALRDEDCVALQEQWSLYRVGVREASDADVAEGYRARRSQALRACPEYAKEFMRDP